eukprot:TRINITY_DN121_c4_g1_i1.p2 TRINITY_DN121_c4_g1~~TRINITY_DN121_c4_g1_i1.p2  ORF type:complete len:485 (-),score=231.06 TRINITY_DN121_c4_g1_i1:464-1918(-)
MQRCLMATVHSLSSSLRPPPPLPICDAPPVTLMASSSSSSMSSISAMVAPAAVASITPPSADGAGTTDATRLLLLPRQLREPPLTRPAPIPPKSLALLAVGGSSRAAAAAAPPTASSAKDLGGMGAGLVSGGSRNWRGSSKSRVASVVPAPSALGGVIDATAAGATIAEMLDMDDDDDDAMSVTGGASQMGNGGGGRRDDDSEWTVAIKHLCIGEINVLLSYSGGGTNASGGSYEKIENVHLRLHVKRYADKTWTQKTMLARVKKDIARDFVGQVTRNCNNIGAALAGALGLKARGKNAGGAARASVDEEDLMPIIPKFKKPLPGGSVAQPPSFKGSAMISSMDSAMGALRGNINSGSASFGRARNSYGGGGDSSAAAAHLSGSSGGGGGGTVIPTRLSETGIVSGGDAAAAAAREMLGVVKPRKKAQGLSRLHEAVKRRRHGHSSSGGSHAQSPLTEAAAAAEAVPPPPTTQASPQPPALPPR